MRFPFCQPASLTGKGNKKRPATPQWGRWPVSGYAIHRQWTANNIVGFKAKTKNRQQLSVNLLFTGLFSSRWLIATPCQSAFILRVHFIKCFDQVNQKCKKSCASIIIWIRRADLRS
ncbi:MAG: hypothetical protein IH624_19615 [Phycisphaerae bacterium]|nr:hypothetical protein [Phycisphaerae bacterium]